MSDREGERTHRRRPDNGLALVASESFETLEPDWARLHATLEPAPPFGHPAWHATWLRHFGDVPGPEGAAPEPVYLAFRVEGELVGVVPLDVAGPRPSLLGDPNICDYSPIAIAAGQEGSVADALFEWLQEDLSTGIALWGLPAEAPFKAAIGLAARAHGWDSSEEQEASCPTVAIGEGFEAFVAALGKHDRHELRRKLRNLEAAGTVAFSSATGPAEAGEAVEQLLHMMRVSREDKDEFLTPVMEAFFRDLAVTAAAHGLGRISTLSIDGAPAASVFSFEDAETAYLYNSGFEPSFSHLAVGLLSKAYAIRDAAARGKREFDFLRGEEEYKRRLGGVARAVVRITLTG